MEKKYTREQIKSAIWQELKEEDHSGANNDRAYEIIGIVTAGLEKMEGEPQPGLAWVKASERLPEHRKDVIITGLLNEQGYTDYRFVAFGHKAGYSCKEYIYFEYGSKSFVATDVQWLDESAVLPTSLHWTPATTKPVHNVGVLVFIPGEDNHITSGMWDVSNEWVLLDEYRTPEEEVTHWMQLPAFPEGHERDVLSDEWVSTLKAIAKEELSKRPSKEGNKSFEYFLGELQSRTDRILRDKGASSKEVYDAINDVMNELRPIFTFDRHESPAAAREEDAVEFAEWLRVNHYEPTFGNKWVNFSMSGSNRFTTAEAYELFKQQKEK